MLGNLFQLKENFSSIIIIIVSAGDHYHFWTGEHGEQSSRPRCQDVSNDHPCRCHVHCICTGFCLTCMTYRSNKIYCIILWCSYQLRLLLSWPLYVHGLLLLFIVLPTTLASVFSAWLLLTCYPWTVGGVVVFCYCHCYCYCYCYCYCFCFCYCYCCRGEQSSS